MILIITLVAAVDEMRRLGGGSCLLPEFEGRNMVLAVFSL